MPRPSLEKHQVLIYLAAIISGLVIGASEPPVGESLKFALFPVLGLLLYTTFTQVPMSHLRNAFTDSRFLAAAIMGNFVVVPGIIWGLLHITPDDPAIRLGVLMVLFVPCTDWFITFTQLGGGDTRRAIAFAPISLLVQIALLPAFLWTFLGEDFTVTIARGEMLLTFLGLIVAPLIAAFLTEKWAANDPHRIALKERMGWFPVPLLAVVVFIISASQVNVVLGSGSLLARLLLVYGAFLIIAGLLARCMAWLFTLPTAQGRVLAFSFGTRNSFVVLPLVLALPVSFEVATVVVVFQSLVELFGMAIYLWWVPKHLFPDTPRDTR